MNFLLSKRNKINSKLMFSRRASLLWCSATSSTTTTTTSLSGVVYPSLSITSSNPFSYYARIMKRLYSSSSRPSLKGTNARKRFILLAKHMDKTLTPNDVNYASVSDLATTLRVIAHFRGVINNNDNSPLLRGFVAAASLRLGNNNVKELEASPNDAAAVLYAFSRLSMQTPELTARLTKTCVANIDSLVPLSVTDCLSVMASSSSSSSNSNSGGTTSYDANAVVLLANHASKHAHAYSASECASIVSALHHMRVFHEGISSLIYQHTIEKEQQHCNADKPRPFAVFVKLSAPFSSLITEDMFIALLQRALGFGEALTGRDVIDILTGIARRDVEVVSRIDEETGRRHNIVQDAIKECDKHLPRVIPTLDAFHIRLLLEALVDVGVPDQHTVDCVVRRIKEIRRFRPIDASAMLSLLPRLEFRLSSLLDDSDCDDLPDPGDAILLPLLDSIDVKTLSENPRAHATTILALRRAFQDNSKLYEAAPHVWDALRQIKNVKAIADKRKLGRTSMPKRDGQTLKKIYANSLQPVLESRPNLRRQHLGI